MACDRRPDRRDARAHVRSAAPGSDRRRAESRRNKFAGHCPGGTDRDPLVKQHLCDALWAVRGEGAHAERLNRLSGERTPLTLRPSRSTSIRHEAAGLARFFPGAREVLAAIDEEIVRGALGDVERGKACFEDQYLSSGGQLYELIAGHDRFHRRLAPIDGAFAPRTRIVARHLLPSV